MYILGFNTHSSKNISFCSNRAKPHFSLMSLNSCLFLEQAFSAAILLRFRNIEQDGNKPLDSCSEIKNELLIITASDEIFQLWSEFITAHSSGGLINPDTGEKFNKDPKFNGGKTFLLHREFFKRMGNLTEDETRKIAVHLLSRTPNRVHNYPKVTVHKIKKVLPHTYSSKDWVERRKRKRIVIQDLNAIKPTLRFCDSDGHVIKKNWQTWKYKHNITNATMNILLELPGKDFFAFRKEMKGRDKFARDGFPHADGFFKHFLMVKGKFIYPTGGSINLREFDRISYEFSNNWKLDRNAEIHLALMDFRDTPGHMDKADTVQTPFFKQFM